jgi:histidine triad (HIT) family protein
MEDCVFCKIAGHQLETDMLMENDSLMVIRDILPKAPVHLLVITKEHIPSVNELTSEQATLIGEMVLLAKQQAKEQGVEESGYKLVLNVGKDGGQVVPHLHLHVLGGKKLE